MANIFVDTNIFIDLIEGRSELAVEEFSGHTLSISPLSVHILTYIYKYAIPSQKLRQLTKIFAVVSLDSTVVQRSLQGPTTDFEDNVQLQSAALADCDIFLTADKQLLKVKFFGKMEILDKL